MLGGEGEGLRWNLQRKADHEIGIDGARAGMGGIDSLNVSVATGLLCEAFLRTPDMAAERMSVQGPQNVEERMF